MSRRYMSRLEGLDNKRVEFETLKRGCEDEEWCRIRGKQGRKRRRRTKQEDRRCRLRIAPGADEWDAPGNVRVDIRTKQA